MKTVKFYTLGCKVNQYETQIIREQFLKLGFEELDNHLPADIYIINTCTVTQRADSDSFNFIRRVNRENPQAKVIVTGCLTELDEDKIKNIDKAILIVKNKDKNRIIERLDNNSTQLITYNLKFITSFKGHTRVFLKLQDGCNNFCSYCKVHLVRGASRSRSLDEIAQEAECLVKNGFKEIVLSGICLGAYGRDLTPQISLVDVISKLESLKELLRIRLSSIELTDVSNALISKIAESKKLCRHLHIPLQSGDDEILKKMNRNYTRGDYLKLIQKIKKYIPEIAITTDVLVGFPGETEINFLNTQGLIKEILPLKVHIFPYSKREGTPAATNFKEVVNPRIIKERISRLQAIAQDCAFNYRKQFLNKKIPLLIEGFAKNEPGFWQGYTDNYLKVLVKLKQDLKDALILVKLNKIYKNYILAELPFKAKKPLTNLFFLCILIFL